MAEKPNESLAGGKPAPLSGEAPAKPVEAALPVPAEAKAASRGFEAVNWINSVVRPKIRGMWRKRDMPENLWVKCPESGQMVYYKDLEANQFVMPGSNYHMRMSATQRMSHTFNGAGYAKLDVPDVPLDPLRFRDERRYTDRLRDAREETGLEDAVMVAEGDLEGVDVVAAVQDFRFMGGSLGMAAGEAVVTGLLRAEERRCPFIMFAASGGARMQEGVLSLMQMPRTTVAVQRVREARLPYIVVLTHPTTGGVTASYAMLGDVHIAEPGALIGFAGPRVIEQTIREQLPEGFQRSEYLREHGMVDMVVHRHELRDTLARLCRVLMSRPRKPNGKGAHASGNGTALAEQGAKSGAVPQLPAPAKDAATARVSEPRTGRDTVVRPAQPTGKAKP
jgi:acetyl-CoA carboxylase carboxyl transferase subunit beta